MFSFDRLKYSKIPIWENRRRIVLLENFRYLINGYYSELRKPRHWANILTPTEQQTLSDLRTGIINYCEGASILK
jgi:hypothetical protein